MSSQNPVPSLPNFRSLGNIPISPTLKTRPDLIYRSAALSNLTPSDALTLQSLSIATTYDLRSTVEVTRYDTDEAGASAMLPAGTSRVHAPVFLSTDYSPEVIALRYTSYASEDTTAGFVAAYRAILQSAGPAFGTVLAAVAREDPTPLLIHCTAGKDRTGVLCAIILALCGVEDGRIADEYHLTEEGLAAWRPVLAKKLLENPALNGDVAGVNRMLGARPEAMLATLGMIREEYGSVEDYVIKECGMSPEAIAQLRRNFIVEDVAA